MYSKAIANGSLVCKLLVACKGGFMFFICKKGCKEKLASALYPLVTMDIDIENEGSKRARLNNEVEIIQFGILTMFHSAFRIALPGYIYGLAYVVLILRNK